MGSGRGQTRRVRTKTGASTHPALDAGLAEEKWVRLPINGEHYVSVELRPPYETEDGTEGEYFAYRYSPKVSSLIIGPVGGATPEEAVLSLIVETAEDEYLPLESVPTPQQLRDLAGDAGAEQLKRLDFAAIEGQARLKPAQYPRAHGDLSLHNEQRVTVDEDTRGEGPYDGHVSTRHTYDVRGFSDDGKGADVDLIPKYYDGDVDDAYLVALHYDEGGTFSYERGLQSFEGILSSEDEAKYLADALSANEYSRFFGGMPHYEVTKIGRV